MIPTQTLRYRNSLAYELNHLVSQRPTSVLSPTSTRLTSHNQLEYLDVFDSFNYPRLRPTPQISADSANSVQHFRGLNVLRFDQVPASERPIDVINTPRDWLDFQEPNSQGVVNTF